MAETFGSGGIKLRGTGSPAEVTALVGSQFELILEYQAADGNPQALTGWSLDAKSEIREGNWSADGELSSLGPVMEGTTVTAVPIQLSTDQNANPGQFSFQLAADFLPEAIAQGIDIDAEDLPTVCIWVRFVSPDSSQIEQARVSVGFRRGYGSLA